MPRSKFRIRVTGRPVFGRESYVPECGIGQTEFYAHLMRDVALAFCDVSNHAFHGCFHLSVRQSEPLPLPHLRRDGKQRPVRADR